MATEIDLNRHAVKLSADSISEMQDALAELDTSNVVVCETTVWRRRGEGTPEEDADHTNDPDRHSGDSEPSESDGLVARIGRWLSSDPPTTDEHIPKRYPDELADDEDDGESEQDDDAPYQCEVCGEEFDSYSKLGGHIGGNKQCSPNAGVVEDDVEPDDEDAFDRREWSGGDIYANDGVRFKSAGRKPISRAEREALEAAWDMFGSTTFTYDEFVQGFDNIDELGGHRPLGSYLSRLAKKDYLSKRIEQGSRGGVVDYSVKVHPKALVSTDDPLPRTAERNQ